MQIGGKSVSTVTNKGSYFNVLKKKASTLNQITKGII